ncbi:MAG: hypothetical protein ABSB71_02225 [Candidatus Bathyarchaeia archaeon]
MELNNKRITNFLLAIQGVGIVFVGIFLAAYLGGMFMNPSNTVLHSEPAFRIPLTIFGIVLLVLVLATVVLAGFSKKD